ncbi:MAG: DEAD/DEAH box helicase, partial [Nanopusillaceae archaeon]
KKILIILPTRLLVKQTLNRLNEFIDKLNIDVKVQGYYGKDKKEQKEKIKEGDYNILVISNQFLSKNFDLLKDKRFDIIFIDDVDSFFKGSKNIERIFILSGFTEEDINIAKKIIDLKSSGKLDFNSDIYKKFLEIRNKEHGIIVLSSATGSLRGKRIKLYKELANFTIGTGTSKLRNILDVYYIPDKNKDLKEQILDIVKKLEDGIIIFVSKEKGINYANELNDFLKNNNIKSEVVTSKSKDIEEIIKKFINKEINVLIGIADVYGILIRGIDIPERIKYVIFVGIPKIRINISNLDKNISNIIILGTLIANTLTDTEKNILLRKIENLKRNLKKLSPDAIRFLSEIFKSEDKNVEGFNKYLLDNLLDLYNTISHHLKNKDIVEKLKNDPEVSITEENGNLILNIVDFKTYLQGSGRSSRLYAGGITKGLSIVIVDDMKLLKSLDAKLRYYLL